MINYLYQNHVPRKRFGQNFLKDQSVIDRIVSAIQPKKNQAMVEIGPGLASLTEGVGKYLDELTVIELDRNLAERLKTHPTLKKKLVVYQEDVMTTNFAKLAQKMGKPLRIFGNLPYNISMPLMFHLLSYKKNVIYDMHLMLQKEVGNRLISRPNSKAYGRLSVIAQYFYNITPVLEVSPSAFTPSPKVSSVMIHFIPHKTMPFLVKDINILNRIVADAFSQRRKIIRNSLKNLFNSELLEKLNIDPAMRAENISVQQYCELANYISDNGLRKES